MLISIKTFFSKNSTAIRVAITIVAIFSLFYFVDLKSALVALKTADMIWFIAAFGLVVLNSVQQAARWRGMLERTDIRLWKYLYFVFMGHFATLFLPSQLGADAIKAVAFGRKHGDIGLNVGVQLANRIAGLIALLSFASLGLVLYYPKLVQSGVFRFPHLTGIQVVLLFAAGCLVVSGIVLLIIKYRHLPILQPIYLLGSNARYLRDALLFSMLIQATSSLAIYCLYKAVWPNPDPWMVILFSSLAQVLLLLPLSIAGIGVREWVLLILFTKIGGVPEGRIVAASLLGYTLTLALAGIGGAWMGMRTLVEKYRQ